MASSLSYTRASPATLPFIRSLYRFQYFFSPSLSLSPPVSFSVCVTRSFFANHTSYFSLFLFSVSFIPPLLHTVLPLFSSHSRLVKYL
jgi:hypothetical protein